MATNGTDATMLSRPAAPSTRESETPFDMVLRRLIDHEIDTMRAAEVRGDPITFDEVVEFYGATRFLYPAKLGVLESRLAAVRTTWEHLIGANNETFKLLMLRRVVNGRLTVKNSVCAFEYAPGIWQAQHLVSADRHEFTGTLAAIMGLLDWISGRANSRAVRFSYRPTNPGTNRLLGGLEDALPDGRCLGTVSNYYVAECGETRCALTSAVGVDIRRAQPSETDGLQSLYKQQHPELPAWLDLDDPQLTTLNARYMKRGLRRSRDVLVASNAGRICGSVVCWWASEGMNFSFLENAIENLVIDATLSTDLRITVARHLLSAAVEHYRSRGRPYVIALINNEMADLVAASEVLPATDKQYAGLTFDAKEIPTAQRYFESHYKNMLFREAQPRHPAGQA